MMRALLIIFVVLSMGSCKQENSFTEKEKAAVADEVQRTLERYYDDIRKSGLSAEFSYLDDSPEFFWVPPGYAGPISYDSVATILKQNAGMYKSVDNSFDSLRVIPLSKELATYTGRLRSVITDTSGKAQTFSLVETGVVIKRKDGWKLLHGQTSMIND